VADRPLRPATRRCLGGPLPRQLADGPRAHPEVVACRQRPPFPPVSEETVGLSRISQPFGRLSESPGQITHVLRTRAPLYSGCPFRARLACVRHAASVRSEPGSNSPIEIGEFVLATHGRSLSRECVAMALSYFRQPPLSRGVWLPIQRIDCFHRASAVFFSSDLLFGFQRPSDSPLLPDCRFASCCLLLLFTPPAAVKLFLLDFLLPPRPTRWHPRGRCFYFLQPPESSRLFFPASLFLRPHFPSAGARLLPLSNLLRQAPYFDAAAASEGGVPERGIANTPARPRHLRTLEPCATSHSFRAGTHPSGTCCRPSVEGG
jgi:hypothetical protein